MIIRVHVCAKRNSNVHVTKLNGYNINKIFCRLSLFF